jgi:endonuclease/exonuclease/phosphatase family metal-dependent hydrolase
LDAIVDKIEREDPDVLVLQEIYDTALAEGLIEKLKERYAHFFVHLGANVMGSVGGCMVISKCAVHKFTNTSFSNNSWTLNRTFATLEIKAHPQARTPCARIIGTHLIHDSNESRRTQVQEIVRSIQNSAPLPTVIMGDLNLERENPEERGILDPYFEHGYTGDEPTCTNEMLKAWDPALVYEECAFLDYISLYRGHAPEVRLLDTHLIRAYDPGYNTRTAVSDHHGLGAVLVWG